MQYCVENDLDVDFFEALKKIQESSHPSTNVNATANTNTNTNDNDNNHADDNACLITYQPLNAFHVQLKCGHKFNYEPLYQEVIRQKGRLGTHSFHQPLASHEIKCPYCRSMTNKLLPYIGTSPHPVIKRLTGVNAPAHMCMPGVPCSTNKCNANAFYEYNEKVYCFRHHQIAIKPKPSKAARTTKAAKAEANETNHVLKTQCVAVNQSGKNKGNQCRLNATAGSTMCKIHEKCNVVVIL